MAALLQGEVYGHKDEDDHKHTEKDAESGWHHVPKVCIANTLMEGFVEGDGR